MMDIPIGSKWRRVVLDSTGNLERFIGQEVEVVPRRGYARWAFERIWIKRKRMDGTVSHPCWVGRTDFLNQFSQVEINLENK